MAVADGVHSLGFAVLRASLAAAAALFMPWGAAFAAGDTESLPQQTSPANAAAPAASPAGARVFAQAAPSLLQIRILTIAGRSQAATGSGFVIGADGRAITNYHVVSELLFYPDRYVGEAVGTAGETLEFELLNVDVRHDLALIRLKGDGERRPLAVSARPLAQGERLFAIGNPKDLGFAMSEGTFNSQAARPYYPQIFFSGAINAGMSGGPAVDAGGAVVGVNVSKRLDGEQLSFLVPAQFVAELAAATVDGARSAAELQQSVRDQLLAHQEMMVGQLLAQPLPTKAVGPYRAPVNEAPGIRCWGDDPSRPELKYRVNRLSCRTEAMVWVESLVRTGFVNVRHEYIATNQLDAFRFMQLYSKAYTNEHFGSPKDRSWTGPQCADELVQGDGANRPPLRAVICVRAMRRFEGLYSFAMMAATVDDAQQGLQTRVDVSGISFDNGRRVMRAFLDAIERQP